MIEAKAEPVGKKGGAFGALFRATVKSIPGADAARKAIQGNGSGESTTEASADNEAEPARVIDDSPAAKPAANPFGPAPGAKPAPAGANPAPAKPAPAKPAANPFGAAPANPAPTKPAANPFGAPAGANPAPAKPAANPFGAP